MMGTWCRIVRCAALAVVLCGLGAGSASAAEPWWHVSPTSRPTNLWVSKPEVQEVKGGELMELKLQGKFVACVGTAGGSSFGGRTVCEVFTGHPYTASAAELQSALEAAYGTSGVTVAEPSASVFVITTPGKFVPEVEAGTDLDGSLDFHGGSGRLAVIVTNIGDAAAQGTSKPVRIEDALPAGVTAIQVQAPLSLYEGFDNSKAASCAIESSETVACTYSGTVLPFESIEMEIEVAVTSNAPAEGVENGAVTVSGAGGPAIDVPQRLRLSSSPTPFGVENYSVTAEEEGGVPDTQAGSHPFQLTTVVNLNQGPVTGINHPVRDHSEDTEVEQQPKQPRNFRFELPAGLVGNATAAPQCSEAKFLKQTEQYKIYPRLGFANACPADTVVGVAAVTIIESGIFDVVTVPVPVFNLVPAEGEPAKFGFLPLFDPVILDTSVRTGEGYSVVVSIKNATELPAFLDSVVTFWGVPGDHRHDLLRGSDCVFGEGPCVRPENLPEKSFLRMPTSCGGGVLPSPMEAEPWNVPLGSEVLTGDSSLAALGNCNRVPFEPGIETAPDAHDASSPSGLTVHVHVPQNENPEGLAESDVRDLAVTLPEGVTLNPSDADGLESCNEEQIGFQGISGSEPRFTPAVPSCPDASKIGTVTVHSPLLPNKLEGAMYLATPAPDGESGMNPFNTLVAMYIVARDPVSGILVKAPVKVLPDPVTGRLTAVSEEIPQLPFEDLELHFFGGGRSPLSTPPRCGSYATSASFTPWAGSEPVQATSMFDITSGPDGGPCPSPLPFAPSLTAGTTSIQAGGFSPFTMTMSREDGNQDLQAVTLKMPPGLSGILTGVKLCPEAQANAGTCPAESLIGETTVSVGLGSEPFTVTGGKVYLTEKYAGAPFGLSIVNPANAGPFHLGNVVVRAKIEVDPQTAALTVTTDNSGPYKIPTILDGIPLEIKHVNVTITRSGFTFNPTSCQPMAVTGALHSTEGATSTVQVPFQATDCAALGFAPKFAVSTSGHTSRAAGASLTVKLSYPNVGGHSILATGLANIREVKVELPKALPSRLTTLQKACTQGQFQANPAGCPPASIVGHAKAVTPLLPVPLEGPAYFVSNGGEAFPNLIVVLQGYGVTIDLVGDTFINEKTGITSSTFKTVPDAPVGSFELTLPEGPYSALTANTSLCKKKLAMPTEFQAQNGALIKTTTKIAVTGCGKARKASHHRRKARRAAHRGKRGSGKHVGRTGRRRH